MESKQHLTDIPYQDRHGNWTNIYLSYCQLLDNNPEQARHFLNNVKNGNSYETGQMDYLLAISYLQENNLKKARSILEASTAAYPWENRIKDLLDEL